MIEQNVARVVYKGDGKTQEFPFSFPVLDRKFIYVVISDKDGRERTLTSDYYVDMDKHVVLYPGYPKGEEPAEAERPAVLAPGEKIVIYRNTPVSQLTSLGDKWPFDVCEKALDKLTMIDQENKESISRTVRLAGATEEVEVILPPPERDTAIGWSEDGKSVINVPVKRWQEEARAAAAEAQTQASMAMTCKEESKEARNKAAQSEEKARDYADAAMSAEKKAENYNKEADRKYNDYLVEIQKEGGRQTDTVKGEGNKQISDVEKAGESTLKAMKELENGAKQAAKEAEEAAKDAHGVDFSRYAKKESLVGLASTDYVDGRFTHLIGASAEALDTLEEIGKSLKNDADFAGTMTKELAKKADRGTVENALMGKAAKTDVYTKSESDKRLKAMINTLYPIGIIITTATDSTPKPGEQEGLAQWEEIGQDRVLQGCSTGAGNTIEAGLPNITGAIGGHALPNYEESSENGALYRIDIGGEFGNTGKSGFNRFGIGLDASKSNGIYGKSNTVQPSALKVHFWKRIK